MSAPTQASQVVAGVRLVRSGVGWRVDGTRTEITYDESVRLWVVDHTSDWFFAKTLPRAVQALKNKGLVPEQKAAS